MRFYYSLGKRNATSKLVDFSSLPKSQFESFGFRGEALHSLATLSSSLTIVTKHDGEGEPHLEDLVAPPMKAATSLNVGTKLQWDHQSGSMVVQSNVARQRGTSVTIGNLFEKIPVRRLQFISAAVKSIPKLITLLQSFALLNPHLGFTLTNQKAK